jgi:hypothetical protein
MQYLPFHKIKVQRNKGSFGRKAQQIEDLYVLCKELVSYNGHSPHERGFLSI